MQPSRRDFLRGAGALVVSFTMAPLRLSANLPIAADEAQEGFNTRPSHIDGQRLESWLAIGGDGLVTAYTGKCDFGQGMYTAQTQLIAEELCVALNRVRLVECDTAVTPDQGSTSGSQSTPTNFNVENLALAAATAREALLGLAAKRLAVPVNSLTAADGAITAKSGASVRYEQLVADHQLEMPLSPTARRKPQEQWTNLGRPVPSLDRPALMTGEFEFLHSLKVPGMLHGRVVRPPAMGCRLLHVDQASVQSIPGVQVVVVRDFVGVVAPTQWAAIRAARTLAVQWSPGTQLPPQATFFEFLRRQAGKDTLSVDSGDVDAQLTRGAHVLRARYMYPYQMHGSVGSSCAVADVHAKGATVWSATQSAYPTRSCVAKLLDLPLESVRVVYTRGSGCYGLNGADAVSFDAALLSRAAGKPVRVQFSRQDEMAWENFGSPVLVEHRAALAADGSIAAWDRENWVAERGGRPGYDRPGNVITGLLVGYEPEVAKPQQAKPPRGKLGNNSNAVPAYVAGCVDGNCGGNGTVRSERVLTHTVASPLFTGSLRSPIRIQNTFANECFMDELAAHAGADPVAFRLRHLKDPRLIGVVRAAAERAGWSARPSPQTGARAGSVSGRGIACVAYEGDNGYAAVVAEVTVDMHTGEVRPTRFMVGIDCGPVSNPDGLRNQTEGGLLQGMSRALIEEVTWAGDRVTSTDWETYRSLYVGYPIPAIVVVTVTPTGVPASGAGETAITCTPAALGNAIFDATGARLRQLPFTPERVLHALVESRRDSKSRERSTRT